MKELKNQVFFGSDQFVEQTQSQNREDQVLAERPKQQRLLPPKPLE